MCKTQVIAVLIAFSCITYAADPVKPNNTTTKNPYRLKLIEHLDSLNEKTADLRAFVNQGQGSDSQIAHEAINKILITMSDAHTFIMVVKIEDNIQSVNAEDKLKLKIIVNESKDLLIGIFDNRIDTMNQLATGKISPGLAQNLIQTRDLIREWKKTVSSYK